MRDIRLLGSDVGNHQHLIRMQLREETPMRPRIALLALSLLAVPLCAQVQSVGDVSFAVADGWKDQQGSDYGGMVLTHAKKYWVVAVYTPNPSSCDATNEVSHCCRFAPASPSKI